MSACACICLDDHKSMWMISGQAVGLEHFFVIYTLPASVGFRACHQLSKFTLTRTDSFKPHHHAWDVAESFADAANQALPHTVDLLCIHPADSMLCMFCLQGKSQVSLGSAGLQELLKLLLGLRLDPTGQLLALETQVCASDVPLTMKDSCHDNFTTQYIVMSPCTLYRQRTVPSFMTNG